MTNEERKTIKRKIVFIEKPFQARFILKFSLLALGSMILASIILYLLSEDTYTMSYRYSRLDMSPTSEAIWPALLGTNLAVLIALIAATIYLTLYVSFRIGGPLFRFSEDMRTIGQGNLAKRINLREGDQLQQFAQVINEMAEQLQAKAITFQQNLSDLNNLALDPDYTKEDLRERIEETTNNFNELFKTNISSAN
jgi:methyl-accepting chemotaxis protein